MFGRNFGVVDTLVDIGIVSAVSYFSRKSGRNDAHREVREERQDNEIAELKRQLASLKNQQGSNGIT